MDGASHSRRRSDHNISYNQTPQHRYNNSERTDFVGITISDDFSQKQLPLLPIMNNASSPSHPSQQKQIPLNSQRQNSYPPIPNPIQQEPPEGHSRRRLDNYVPNSPSGHYTLLQTPTSQHPNVQPHQRSLSGHQLQQSPQQSQSYSPHSHNKTHQPSHTNSRQHRRPSHSQLQQSSGQQPPPPPQLAPPIQIGYKSTYSPNSQPSSPIAVTTSQNKPSQQLNQSRTDFGGEYRTTAFRKVRSISDLRPQPARRVESSKVVVSTLKALTIYLTSTYQNINPHFRYDLTYNPRRVLTKPSKGVKNDGFDNEDCDYILYVNDILGSEEGQKYLILDVLGQGTFGQVVKCQNLKTKDIVAVKVVKNKPAYFNQSMMEVTILELVEYKEIFYDAWLNQTWDNQDQHHILRLLDTFIHRRHLCLVFELLSVNLYELIKQNQFRGLSTNLVRVFTAQLLDALTVLNEARIIHCDLKPENVLLKKCVKSSLESPTIKVIDFGSACHERQTVYTYIQSRFYRSPEVLLGLPYSSSIDMWSLGCIAVELFLGLPLFPGSSEYNQVSRIVEMMGIPPAYMIEVGKTAHEYFDRYMNEHGQKKYRLKSMEQYMREHNTVEQPSKRYFSAGTLPEIVQSYPIMRKGLTQKDIDKEMQNRLAFIDFVQGLLNLNPIERWSPQQAKLHPFITGEKFTGKFTPPMQIKATNKMGTSTQPISSNSSNPTPNLMQIPSPIKYKASNNSPKVQPKNPLIIAHDMPTLKLSHVPASNSHVPPSRQKPQQQQQISNKMSSLAPKSSISSLRPRASTIGNIQIPPQIQRAAALVTPGSIGASPVEHSKKDPRRLPQNYPHLQLLQERDQQHELPQFSVIVDSNENNRASDQTNSPNNNTLSGGNKVDIRNRDDVWQDKEGRNHQDERLLKDERNKSPTVSSNEDKITDNNTENETLKSMIMPGSMPNGAAGFGISSGGLDDSILGTSGPPLHLTQQYHQKSLQQLQQMQIEQSKNNTPNNVLPQHHHYQQSGLRHPSPLPVSVNVVSPIMTQAHPRPSNFRSSPSYNNQSPSSFRNSPSHYTTPSTSPYMTHSQHHQLPLPATHPQPKQQQSSSSIASSGNYHHNLALPANYDQHNLHSQQSNRNHRISPSTSPSYPPNNPSSGYGIPSSPTYELPSD
ncbi:10335_t:CDS:2 [Funneliformis caledonium]|uniref:10335_t:CDS:1 n=1 Tax=Funneliformis caledonium TaxID=1117310 RepID=A0A9N9FIT4_9GLOM|nr:10335_t:CDS:2 [Funneliformis caledonium]